jgi:hypothetical protein
MRVPWAKFALLCWCFAQAISLRPKDAGNIYMLAVVTNALGLMGDTKEIMLACLDYAANGEDWLGQLKTTGVVHPAHRRFGLHYLTYAKALQAKVRGLFVWLLCRFGLGC